MISMCVFDGHVGVEKFDVVLVVESFVVASTCWLQLIRGGVGCRYL